MERTHRNGGAWARRVCGWIAAGLVAGVAAGCPAETPEPDPEAELAPTVAVPPERPPEPPEPEPEEPPYLEIGEAFWAGEETVAYELVGRFASAEAMATSLDALQPVGRVDDRDWVLGDILVSVEYRVPGESAVWRVAGPADVVGPYVERLREGVDARSPVTDLGVLPLEPRR